MFSSEIRARRRKRNCVFICGKRGLSSASGVINGLPYQIYKPFKEYIYVGPFAFLNPMSHLSSRKIQQASKPLVKR